MKKQFMRRQSKIKNGGYVAGRDFGRDDVTRVVMEILGTPEKVFKDSSWIFKNNC